MLQICYLQLAATLLFSLSSLRQRDLFPCTVMYHVNSRHMFPPGPNTVIISDIISPIWVGCLRAHRLASKQRKRSPKTQCDGRWPCAHFLGGLFKERPGFHRKVQMTMEVMLLTTQGNVCIVNFIICHEYFRIWISRSSHDSDHHTISYTSTKARKSGSIELMVKLQMLMPTSHHVKNDGIFG